MVLSVLCHISQLKQVVSLPSPCFGTVIQDPALINYPEYPEPGGRGEGVYFEATLLNLAVFVCYDLHASAPKLLKLQHSCPGLIFH